MTWDLVKNGSSFDKDKDKDKDKCLI